MTAIVLKHFQSCEVSHTLIYVHCYKYPIAHFICICGFYESCCILVKYGKYEVDCITEGFTTEVTCTTVPQILKQKMGSYMPECLVKSTVFLVISEKEAAVECGHHQ